MKGEVIFAYKKTLFFRMLYQKNIYNIRNIEPDNGKCVIKNKLKKNLNVNIFFLVYKRYPPKKSLNTEFYGDFEYMHEFEHICTEKKL